MDREARALTAPWPEFTNLDKLYWPEDGFTKGHAVAYYTLVGPTLVPYLRDRPMVLERHPDGIHGKSFYHKNLSQAPAWVRKETIYSSHSERDIHYVVVDSVASLLYCIQLGAISLSPWSSRMATLGSPDYAILDLDPGDACPFDRVIEVAWLCRAILDEVGLRGYPKTSGATGLHVKVPLEPRASYDDVRLLCEGIARVAEARRPDLATTVRAVKDRPQDRVYVDFLQNGPGKTIVCEYSLRAKPHAPVSAPLRWEEVRFGLRPEHFHIWNFAQRLLAVGDLYRPLLEDLQRIDDAQRRLAALPEARSSGGRRRRPGVGH
jgi:bifunctional non-homologous end joining protein LigD